MKQYAFRLALIALLVGTVQASQQAPQATEVAESKTPINNYVGSSTSSASSVPAPATMTVATSTSIDDDAKDPVFLKTEAGEHARAWWRLACQDDVEAQYCLACCYDAGMGVERDEVKAYKWFKEASLVGNISALLAVASCKQFGIGTKQDIESAINVYKLSDLRFQLKFNGARLAPACYALDILYRQLAEDAEVEEVEAEAAGAKDEAAEAADQATRYNGIARRYFNTATSHGLLPAESYFSFWPRVSKIFGYMPNKKASETKAALAKMVMLPEATVIQQGGARTWAEKRLGKLQAANRTRLMH